MGTKYFHLTHPPMAAVENFWQQLKHTNYLHNVARLCLDQILQPINRVITPAYFASSEILDDNFRLGRTWSLTGTDHDLLEVFLICCANSTICQKYFKKSWSCQTKLALRKKKKPEVLDVRMTTAFSLCAKHFVQAVPSPPTPILA